MKRITAVFMLGIVSLLWNACGKEDESKSKVHAPATVVNVSLTGAGATFPYPLYSKWMSEFEKLYPHIKMNYQSIGSGGGIRQITAETVDFGATDGPMKDEELKKTPRGLLHIPMTLGAVVPIYNLPNFTESLKFTGEVLANIYLGKIVKWNDSALKEINPTVELPDKEIVVVHRSDGSGTTYIWVDYLCKISQEWQRRVGLGTSVNWPVGIGGKGNEGVTAQVKEAPYSIGYVELIYALSNNIPYGTVKNAAGEYIKASIESVTQAAATAKMPEDMRVSITNAPGKDAYPLSSFTWVLVYKEQKDETKGEALVQFLKWAIHEGQQYAEPLHYAPLPEAVVRQDEEKIRSLTSGGKPLWK